MDVFKDLDKIGEFHCEGLTGADLAAKLANGTAVDSAAVVEDVKGKWFINITLSDNPERRFSLCLHDSLRIKDYVQVNRALDKVFELEPKNPIVVFRQHDTWPATSAFL